MSVLIAVDPNVLLGVTLGDRHCIWAIEELSERANELCLALDDQNQIFSEYDTLETHLLANNVTKVFIEKFLNARSRRQRIKNSVLNDDERHWLATELSVTEPVEPELIAVAKASPGRPMVVVVGKEGLIGSGVRERATNSSSIIDQLHERYRFLCISPAKSVPKQLGLIERSRYPGTEGELKAYIGNGETEFIEFKQPQGSGNTTGQRILTTQLTQSIIIQALKSVCAMLNCEGGKVFVGITPEAELMGIDPPVPTTSGKPDDDALSRRFTDQFNRFRPPVNQFVKLSVIPLGSDRRVCALHVEKGHPDTRYAFNDNHTISVYDRCGPSTRSTEVLQHLR